MEDFSLKQDEIAERVSKSRTAVTNSMRLLKLDKRVQQMVVDEMISTGHARALLSLENDELQYTVAQKIFDEKLSVREKKSGRRRRSCLSQPGGKNKVNRRDEGFNSEKRKK